MSTPLFVDQEVGLPIRNKINNLSEMLRIMETNAIIPAGSTTAIPIAALERDLLPTGEHITLLDKDTGATYELTTDDAAMDGETSIAIVSYTFLTDIPSGSSIYYKYTDALARLFAL